MNAERMSQIEDGAEPTRAESVLAMAFALAGLALFGALAVTVLSNVLTRYF